jgi:AraC-like DNA-binding protein
MRFDAALLDHPLVTADRAALRLAREACEQQLEALGPSVDVLNRVRQLLPGDAGGYRSLAAVARLMHVSERTLKRRLADRRESYSGLLDEHRHAQALALLAEGAQSIEQIADRLGYSDAANFTRAFRRWTGGPPNRRRSKRA